MSQPNFVIVQADQLAGPSLPMYGNSIVQMPSLSFVQEALLEGKWTGWDHQPFEDATRA